MEATHINADTGQKMPAHAVSGVTGFVSWRRLREVFARAGETTGKEQIASWQIDERGITFRLKD